MLNQNPNTFTFNGHSSDEFGIRIERKPDLNRSGRKFESASVDGRNGQIYQLQDAWEEVIVSYDIYAGGREKGDAVTSFTDIVEWLNSANDYAVLSDSYDPTHYRMAVFVDTLDIESQWHTIGHATVQFRCRPERFILEEPITVESGGIIENPTNHIAKPIITLTGTNAPNLLSLNRTMNTTITQVQTTRNLSALFQEVGTSQVFWGYMNIGSKPSQDTLEYIGQTSSERLITLSNSTGTIEAKTTGYMLGMFFDLLDTSTDQSYRLAFDFSGNGGGVRFIFCSGEGNMSIISHYVANITSQTKTIRLDYVPNEARYMVILFGGFYNDGVTYSNVRLNRGTTAYPFRPHVDNQTYTFTIGERTLTFETSGFLEAVIDCESENFLMDGNSANNVTSITENGNLAVNYLQLDKGDNTITCSEDITAVSVDRRLWEL